ncbi:hypothetical protein [Nonlabens agnitus]|uniref:Uncharacterized protein n=1 Tax=Nonlabens agnitus TaxID=870484 RepID=A0A2S9WXE1_9FLAO|nr:hypothetical protein [Nonlabens agnitus]PRP68133.1 hypothetical protein BST86_14060 [Nonlabens agnitus]
MISYAESQGEKPFDWYSFLNKENISDQEWQDAIMLSNDWVTCACGNQCNIIPREDEGLYYRHNGRPKDNLLSDLGGKFHGLIKRRYATKAIVVLQEIENRSAYLIAQIQQQQSKTSTDA